MTTIVLQTAGAFLGGLVGGPAGAAIGRGLGALAGGAIDQRLFGDGDRVVEGPRLGASQVLSSREGAVLPQAFGRVRLAGEVIWATRFDEVQESEERGGKGAPTTTVVSYSYLANFAVALCEGEIGGIGRIWADGRLLNNDELVYRVHRGDEAQRPDSLIEAKQAAIGSAAPAYRGTAYIVFEQFPLADYGNRIPQIAVEVLRPVGPLASGVRAVSIIPAATEFGYDPEPVVARAGDLGLDHLNSHVTTARTDWSASIDELQASCANVERASLVVAWFGTDLRAGYCRIEPRVSARQRLIKSGERWAVAGLQRADANVVSGVDGRAAYGGTPSDGAVTRAIADLRARGLAVTFNPFVLMDIAADNPMGQPQYPWRGRIVCDDAKADAAAFEAVYRPMILHYANLCAGTGVDLFVLGSELRGLTQSVAPDGSYPFIAVLKRLAADVRAILGPGVRLTYGADWSEYANHRPTEGMSAGDVRFPLDELWADPNIDLVGIDNYLPLTDWRDGGDPAGEARSSRDPNALAAGIEGGEYYDWFYATASDREAGNRRPIADGQGEPWIYRAKDIASWWANPHHERIAGVRSDVPTAWQPESKPVAFLELGCPAIHAGANQPNVFLDAKSSESFLPHHSDGGRDDEMQAAFLEAHFSHWADSGMVDPSLTHVWAWDARPWPAFPDRTDVWSDGANWARGHWLNGRATGLRVRDLLDAILRRAGVEAFDVSGVEGMATGYVLGSAASARGAVESVLDLYSIDAFERRGTLVFRSRGLDPVTLVADADIVEEDDKPNFSRTRAQEGDLPRSAVLEHLEPSTDFQPAAAQSRRLAVGSRREASLSLPLVLDDALADMLVERWLHRRWAGRETLTLSLPVDFATLFPGAAVRLPSLSGDRLWRVASIDEGFALTVTLSSTEFEPRSPRLSATPAVGASRRAVFGEAHALVMDLPLLAQPVTETGARIAVAAKPWPGPFVVHREYSGGLTRRLQRVEERAVIGRLRSDLPPGRPWRWDEASVVEVELLTGALSSAPRIDVLNGANAFAVRSGEGWEVLQFRDARLVAMDRYVLSGLLRGQAGTEDLMGAEAGADFVRLNSAVETLNLPQSASRLELLVAPARVLPTSERAVGASVERPGRDLQPYRPVHLTARRTSDGTRLTWLRRDRGPSDTWETIDVPMSEANERYVVEHLRGEEVISSRDTQTSEAMLTSVQAGDEVRVAQVSALVGAGPFAAMTVH